MNLEDFVEFILGEDWLAGGVLVDDRIPSLQWEDRDGNLVDLDDLMRLPEDELMLIAQDLILNQIDEDRVNLVPTSQSAIDSLESFLCKESGVDCSICIEEIEPGAEALRLPCSHMFHAHCIIQWLRTSHNCPLCRYQMPTHHRKLYLVHTVVVTIGVLPIGNSNWLKGSMPDWK